MWRAWQCMPGSGLVKTRRALAEHTSHVPPGDLVHVSEEGTLPSLPISHVCWSLYNLSLRQMQSISGSGSNFTLDYNQQCLLYNSFTCQVKVIWWPTSLENKCNCVAIGTITYNPNWISWLILGSSNREKQSIIKVEVDDWNTNFKLENF